METFFTPDQAKQRNEQELAQAKRGLDRLRPLVDEARSTRDATRIAFADGNADEQALMDAEARYRLLRKPQKFWEKQHSLLSRFDFFNQ
jgi:predicted exporter